MIAMLKFDLKEFFKYLKHLDISKTKCLEGSFKEFSFFVINDNSLQRIRKFCGLNSRQAKNCLEVKEEILLLPTQNCLKYKREMSLEKVIFKFINHTIGNVLYKAHTYSVNIFFQIIIILHYTSLITQRCSGC